MAEKSAMELVEELHEVILRRIAVGDWVMVVEALDVLGDIHRDLGSPFTASTYAHARQIATKHGVAVTPTVWEKWEGYKHREISLDEVNISSQVYEAWMAIAERIAFFLASAGVDPDSIPDERIRVEEDGSLTVWVEVTLPSGAEFEPSMTVPPGQWHWR